MKVPSMVMDLDHCQVVSVIMPSGSDSIAVIAVPTTGWVGDRVTVPASSSLVTMTVTSCMAISLPASALTVTM